MFLRPFLISSSVLIFIGLQAISGQTLTEGLPALTQPTGLPELSLVAAFPELALAHVVMHPASLMADIGLILHSQNLHWTVADHGKRKADLTLTSQVVDQHGKIIGGSKQSLSVFADTENATLLAATQFHLSVKVTLPAETKRVRFLVQPAFAESVSAFEVDRGTLDAAAYRPPPPPPSVAVGPRRFCPWSVKRTLLDVNRPARVPGTTASLPYVLSSHSLAGSY